MSEQKKFSRRLSIESDGNCSYLLQRREREGKGTSHVTRLSHLADDRGASAPRGAERSAGLSVMLMYKLWFVASAPLPRNRAGPQTAQLHHYKRISHSRSLTRTIVTFHYGNCSVIKLFLLEWSGRKHWSSLKDWKLNVTNWYHSIVENITADKSLELTTKPLLH